MPSICIEEYVLRYSNFFTNQGKTTGPVIPQEDENGVLEEEDELLKKSRLKKEKELLQAAELPIELVIPTAAAPSTSPPVIANDLSVQGSESRETETDNLPFDTRTFEKMTVDIERMVSERNDEEEPFLLLPVDVSISEGSAKKKKMEKELSVIIDKKVSTCTNKLIHL